jgi:hypothetical protein
MMKHKKFSSAILCGFKLVDGRQHIGGYSNHAHGDSLAVCVLGAGNLCLTGVPRGSLESMDFEEAFKKAWGFNPAALNDGRLEDSEPMPWEHIYGMARAAGL